MLLKLKNDKFSVIRIKISEFDKVHQVSLEKPTVGEFYFSIYHFLMIKLSI